MKLPVEFVTACVDRFVAVLFAVTLTPGTTASEESVIRPVIIPRDSWECNASRKTVDRASALAKSNPGLLTKPDPGGPPSAGMITSSLPAVCGLRHGVSCGTLYPSTSGSFLASAEEIGRRRTKIELN